MQDIVQYVLRPHLRNGADEDGTRESPSLDLSVFDEPEDSGLDLTKYWLITKKHLTLILALFSLTFAVFAFRTFTEIPLYTAQTILLVKQRMPDILNKPEGVALTDEDSSDNYYKTQTSILQSRSLAAMVIKDLDLVHDRAFLGQQDSAPPLRRLVDAISKRSGAASVLNFLDEEMGRLRGVISGMPIDREHPLVFKSQDNDIDRFLVGRYLGMLSVSTEPGTSLVRIAFSTPNGELSSRLANAHAQAYSQLGVDLHNRADQAAQKFLEARMVELRSHLEKSEVALNDYRRANDIIPGLMSLDGKETVVVDRLRDLSKELTDAELERIELEAQVQLIDKKQYNLLPTVQNTPVIQTLQASLNTEYSDIASLSGQFKPDYPPLADLEAKASKTREILNRAVTRVVEGIEAGYQVAVGKESKLHAEMDRQKQTALGLNDAAVKYAMLQREVDTNRELTNNVLQKMKDVGLEAESEASNVSIIDKAEVPIFPASPRRMRNLLEGALVGLIVGFLLALAVENFRNTFSTPEELAVFLRLPNLGMVPELLAKDKHVRDRRRTKRLSHVEFAEVSTDLISPLRPFSLVSEAFRSIRTGLLLSRVGSPPKVTLFTSAVGGEGKTTTAVNTATMLAHAGARVLLVDADLRRGRCAKILGIGPSSGLTELLIGVGNATQLTHSSKIPNLYVLASGMAPPNSTELVGSQRMREVLANFSREYDFVLVDAPPLLPVSDAVILTTMVDGVVLVVDIGRTPKKQIKAGRMRLIHARAKVFGFVINRVSSGSIGYQYYSDDYDRRQTG